MSVVVTNPLINTDFNSFTLPRLAADPDGRRYRDFANFEERNLYTLLLYMGLSSSSSWQQGDGQNEGEDTSHIGSGSEEAEEDSNLMVPEMAMPQT